MQLTICLNGKYFKEIKGMKNLFSNIMMTRERRKEEENENILLSGCCGCFFF